MTMQSTDRAAHETMVKHFSDLCQSPFDPGSVARELLSAEIIGDATLFNASQQTVIPGERRMEILRAVMANGGKDVFQTFVKVLMNAGKQNSFICERLIATYKTKGGKWVDPSAATTVPPQLPTSSFASGWSSEPQLDFFSVIRQLNNFDASYWRLLGTSLQVPPHRLNEITATTAFKPHGQNEALTSVVDYWIKNDLTASWEKLAMAVEQCEDGIRAYNIRVYAGLIAQSSVATPVTPTAPSVSRPPSSSTPPPLSSGKLAEKPALGDIQYIETADGEEFSIPEVVGTSYRCFASYLLRDEDGQTVQKLEKKHGENAGDIVFDVLQQWTQGKGRECNWKNLLSGLKACGRKDESEKIKKHLTQC